MVIKDRKEEIQITQTIKMLRNNIALCVRDNVRCG